MPFITVRTLRIKVIIALSFGGLLDVSIKMVISCFVWALKWISLAEAIASLHCAPEEKFDWLYQINWAADDCSSCLHIIFKIRGLNLKDSTMYFTKTLLKLLSISELLITKFWKYSSFLLFLASEPWVSPPWGWMPIVEFTWY